PGSRPHAHRARTESTRRLRLRDPYLRRIESRAARGACGHVTLPDPVPALRARRRAHPRRACAVSRVPEPAGTCRCLTAEGGTLSAVGANSFARDATSDAKGRMNSALQALSRIRLRSATLASINTLNHCHDEPATPVRSRPDLRAGRLPADSRAAQAEGRNGASGRRASHSRVRD